MMSSRRIFGWVLVAGLLSLGGCKFPYPGDVDPATLGGTVDGLWLPNTIELRLRSGATDEILRVTANGDFSFEGILGLADEYEVSMTQPSMQQCQLVGATGTVAAGHVSAVAITCAPVAAVDVRISAPLVWTFDPSVVQQSIRSSILVQEVDFTVLAPTATEIAVDGALVTSGAPAPPTSLAEGENTITVAVTVAGLTGTYEIVWSRGAMKIEQFSYAKPPTVPGQAQMGVSVAYDGVRMAIGAPGDDTAGPDRGAVYIFRRNGTSWTQEAIVTPTTLGPEPSTALFGFSVALQGSYLVVGAPGDSTTCSRTTTAVPSLST